MRNHLSGDTGRHDLFEIGFAGKDQMETFLEQNRHAVVDGFLFDLFSGGLFDNLFFNGFVAMEQLEQTRSSFVADVAAGFAAFGFIEGQ